MKLWLPPPPQTQTTYKLYSLTQFQVVNVLSAGRKPMETMIETNNGSFREKQFKWRKFTGMCAMEQLCYGSYFTIESCSYKCLL